MSIFEERVNLKPYEYPELLEFADAINNAYWIVGEFNFTKDIQDFKVNLSEYERGVIKRAMLAISQIEVSVKTFWADLYRRMPKPEIAAVGYTFADSEVRHVRAYSHLLEILGLNEEFEGIMDVPEIEGRVKYLKKYLSGARSRDDRTYTKSVILFSMFIEHVSLFSQFLIIMSFNKERNLLPGISNVVEATSSEEQIHGLFGAKLVEIVRKEFPEWFDEEMDEMIKSAANKALKAELEILDWIYGEGELEFLPKDNVREFLKNRFNIVLTNGGFNKQFDVDQSKLDSSEWFEVQLKSIKENDFFYKTATDYSKGSKSITEDDLF